MKTSKNIIGRCLYVITACFLLASCNQSTTPEDHLPKECVVVAKTNTKRIAVKFLADKLSDFKLSDILGDKSMTDARPPADSLRHALNNPSEAGIDILADVYAVINAKKDTHDRDFGIVYFQLNDAEKFAQFLGEKMPKSYNFQFLDDKNNFHHGSLEGGKMIGWNENFAMLISPLSPEANTNTEAFFTELTALKSDDLVSKDENYQLFDDQSADIKIWMNGNKADFSRLHAKAGQGAVFLKSLENANYQHAYINFEAGKIMVDNKTFVDKDAQADWEKLLKTQQARSTVLNHFAEDQISGFISLKYNPRLITHLTEIFIQQSIGQNPAAGLIFAGAGITPEALTKMFKGDILIASTGMTDIKQEVITYEFDENFNRVPKTETRTTSIPEVLISMSAEDQIQKMLDTYRLAGVLQQESGAYVLAFSGMRFYAQYQEGNLLISNSLQAIERTQGEVSAHRLAKLASDYALSGYIHPKQIYQAVNTYSGGMKSTENQAITIQEILMHVDELKDGAVKSRIDILMDNSEENALVGLLKMLQKKQAEPAS